MSAAAVRALGSLRRGVVCGALADLAEGAAAPVYVHRNPSFRLPDEAGTPIVMIGAGTGIAPFRAFVKVYVQHRLAEQGAVLWA